MSSKKGLRQKCEKCGLDLYERGNLCGKCRPTIFKDDLEKLRYQYAQGELNALIYGEAKALVELLLVENDDLYAQLQAMSD